MDPYKVKSLVHLSVDRCRGHGSDIWVELRMYQRMDGVGLWERGRASLWERVVTWCDVSSSPSHQSTESEPSPACKFGLQFSLFILLYIKSGLVTWWVLLPISTDSKELLLTFINIHLLLKEVIPEKRKAFHVNKRFINCGNIVACNKERK